MSTAKKASAVSSKKQAVADDNLKKFYLELAHRLCSPPENPESENAWLWKLHKDRLRVSNSAKMAIFAENGANMEIDLTIEQTGPHEAIPYELLYEADPSREAVADYIARGSCYIARIEGRTVGVSVLLRTRPFTMELVNLCVAEPYRRQGIATRLIVHAAERARAAECRILEVGTGNAGIGQLALYQRCGFSIESIEKDYFVRHYPEPIYENGIECRDMVRLRMEL